MSTLTQRDLQQKGSIYTATEIASQPEVWRGVMNNFFLVKQELQQFLQFAYQEADNIVLTGAGTSAFIGLSLQGCFSRNTGMITRAIATTDIVSHPADFFNHHQTPFIISFARSGNSPESCAALQLAEKFSKNCFHLIITCDGKGALANYKTDQPHYTFVLPEAANDKSLAMTSSYSGMLLTGLLTAYIQQEEKCKEQVELLIYAAGKVLENYSLQLQQLAKKNFKRAVFLGSGSLFGTATEAALKLQELTDGRIICKADTYLGLRHGPKAVIDNSTLVVYFFSNDRYVYQYEKDLVVSMKLNNALYQLGVSENPVDINELDMQVNYGVGKHKIMEEFLPVCAIVSGQLLGFYKSLELGLTPDTPSTNGAISRVVQGVNIYPLEEMFNK